MIIFPKKKIKIFQHLMTDEGNLEHIQMQFMIQMLTLYSEDIWLSKLGFIFQETIKKSSTEIK